MTHEHVLRGCTPTPLAAYLKALAVLRLVAEQAADPDATGAWRDDEFVLRTRLNEEQLHRFFLEDYAPTPLVAPWNGGSGFYLQEGKLNEKDAATGRKLKTGVRNQPTEATRIVDAIERSTAKRFDAYRDTIGVARRAVSTFGLAKAPENKPFRRKDAFIGYFRNVTSESALKWLDASLVLADGEPEYPPLLGTGGNDGNLDFTTNFMQNLAEVLSLSANGCAPESNGLLPAALFGWPVSALADRAVGQFAPGSAGGANTTSGFEGAARVNPWDFILALEGAVLFAASAARRLESSTAAVLSAPFTVRSRLSTGGASATSDDSDARGEIWMPLWTVPFTIEEVIALFMEGRAAVGTRRARDGLDFARAAARLGVDRGIAAFQRYGFLKRSGKAFLATPLARVPVRRNQQADLIDDLEQRAWLGRAQRHARDDTAPKTFRVEVAQLDAALFALTQRADRFALQIVLRQLGRIDALCASSPKTREAIGPVPALRSEWARQADDGSAEFRVAAALAGLSLRGDHEGKRVQITLRPHLAPVTFDGMDWDDNSRWVSWGHGLLEPNLAAVLHRRRLEAARLGGEGELLRSVTGACISDVQRFIEGATDDRRIGDLLRGLACADLDGLGAPRVGEERAPLSAYALLKPLFTPESMLRYLEWLPADRSLRLPAEIPGRLSANDVAAALRLAWQQLRALGVKLPGRQPPRAIGIDGPRLLAGLMIPLTLAETGRLLRWLDLTPDFETQPEPVFKETA